MVHDFDELVKYKKAIVLCYASYNTSCLNTIDRFKELSLKYNKIDFCLLNVTKNYDLKRYYRLNKIPSYLFIKDGILIYKADGNTPIKVLEKKLEVL